MPFGLRNAPAVFQSLMQRVLAGLNPDEGAPFVSVYLDDILIFSETFEEHLHHLELVLKWLSAAGLKLKPSKCQFIRTTVEYLGMSSPQWASGSTLRGSLPFRSSQGRRRLEK